MNQQRWKQVEEIVDTALSIDQAERDDYIEEACKGDKELKTRVTKLLENIEQAETANYLEEHGQYQEFEADLAKSAEHSAGESLIGREIGAYKILELIGHGGMGSVYAAERSDKVHDEQLALKILPRGMDTPSNLDRFKRERKILAKLDHPNIARLLDGGITEDGLPYLVMEYVEGMPLDKYCDQHRLSVKQRLELFGAVCRAVQHAHQNTVIHRDLKPSNILVTENGTLKVLDFGIAKLLEPDDPETTIFQTRTGARMFTLGYAAPEQVEGDTVTTAADTYGLGVLLYEILAGVHPFDLGDKKLTEIETLIREQTPNRPSVKFRKLSSDQQKQVSDKRGTSPSTLFNLLQGDLDAIVMKTLRKEPTARYSSVEQLLDDLRRREENLPLIAQEDTWRYKTSKFIKRHKTGLWIAAGFLLLIIGFATFYTWQITQERNEAQEQRNRAQEEARKSEAVTTFLTDLIKANYPENAQGDTITVREFLSKGYNKLHNLSRSPAVQANVMQVMAHTYQSLGELDKADSLISQVVTMQDTMDIGTSEKATSYNLYGLILRDQGQISEAEQAMEQSADLYKRTENTETAEYTKLLRDLAYIKRMQGNYDQALPLARQALNIEQRIYGKSNIQTAETYFVLASILQHQHKYEQAKKNQLKSLKIINANIDGPHPGKATNFNNLGNIYESQDSLQKAKMYYQKALQMNEELYGGVHSSIATSASNLADVLKYQDKLNSAEVLIKRAIKVRTKTSGKNHPYLANHLNNYANLYRRQKKFERADSLYLQAINIFEKNYGPDHPKIVSTKFNRAVNAHFRGNNKYAKSLLKAVIAIRKDRYEVSDEAFQNPLQLLVKIYEENNQPAKADSLHSIFS